MNPIIYVIYIFIIYMMDNSDTNSVKVDNPDIREGMVILARMIARHLRVSGNRGDMKISDSSQAPEEKDRGYE